MNRSAKESHKRISDSRNFGLYLHLITFALNGTPKESPRANTEWPNLSHYNFRFRNKQTISAQNKLAYCNSAIIRIIWYLLALWSSYRLNVQFEFADSKPVICPTVCTTYSFSHSDILSVLPLHYDIVNEMPMFGARVHSCLSASW